MRFYFHYSFLSTAFLLLLASGCSKGPGEKLFGKNFRMEGITKELPKLSAEKFITSKMLGSDYQKSLDTLFDTELVKVETLHLYQNKDSYRPLLDMIRNTKKYFFMNVLSFTCDNVTEEMVGQLELKAKSGMDIRLIVNTGFSYLSMPCLKRLRNSGVKIVKARTHSSYFFNDQQELMIGSQSVARMFFLADGFNSLDRDMMIYATGPLASDAYRDFISIWSEHAEKDYDKRADLNYYQELMKNDYAKKNRGSSLYTKSALTPDRYCRFISERPNLGVKDIQVLWKELVNINQKELFFSGVMVDIGAGDLGHLIKAKSNQGMSVHYLGNSFQSGNGELSMVIDEWMANIRKGSFSFIAPALEKFNQWDKTRLALKNQKLYDALKSNASISVWGYFNFIHYKVWLFDHPGFFIGSANLDEAKFGEISDAGIYCMDAGIHQELKQMLERDKMNSMLYQPAIEVKK
ncbi:MAG: hypothetical protein WC635_12650 [Bacteriovorax sp.]|jgi:phosphatidylserine/phosphatidylglycerophosphate/cardiolipin synthase-like enzyme